MEMESGPILQANAARIRALLCYADFSRPPGKADERRNPAPEPCRVLIVERGR